MAKKSGPEGTKKKGGAAPPDLPKPAAKPLPTPKPPTTEERVSALEGRVTELEGDLLRIAQLAGEVWGEPIASKALEIVRKRQGKAPAEAAG